MSVPDELDNDGDVSTTTATDAVDDDDDADFIHLCQLCLVPTTTAKVLDDTTTTRTFYLHYV